jgi:hypothetical protein
MGCFAGNSMRSNRNYTGPDLLTLTAMIAHSQIAVTLAARQRFPGGFDDRDVAILEWIATEGHHAKQSHLQGPGNFRNPGITRPARNDDALSAINPSAKSSTFELAFTAA